MGVVNRVRAYLWASFLANDLIFAWDSTDITEDLNRRIAPSADHTHPYTGGKGVLVRDPFDGYQDDNLMYVVPATFWSNDIYAPSQMYPDVSTQAKGTDDVWKFASVGYVIGKNMPAMFYDYDNLQSDSWGWGVFYARDSNSVDIRCRWLESYWAYDCPKGWLDGHTGKWTDVPTKRGSGGYPAGNPYLAPNGSVWGGGTGCHLARDTHTIDQVDAYDSKKENLVQNRDCECNYVFDDYWGAWVDDWVQNANHTPSPMSFWGDRAICWVKNLRMMINMQNWLYWKWHAKEWTEKLSWPGKGAEREYVGWNEVPVDRTNVGKPEYWDAFVVKLPANVCGTANYNRTDVPECLDKEAQTRLEDRIDEWVKKGYIKPGVENIAVRPGSYTVFAQEYKAAGTPNWQRVFFCQPWTGPTGRWQVVSVPMSTSNPTGACYVEHGNSSKSSSMVVV